MVSFYRLQKLVIPRSTLRHICARRMYRTPMVNSRHTLTHLDDMEDNCAFDDRGGLVQFVVNECPKLRFLNVSSHHSWHALLIEIYFPFLFTKNTALLESVRIANYHFESRHLPLISTRKVNLDTLDLTSNNTSKSLSLVTSRMDTGNLQLIMIKFKNLKRLEINMSDRVTVNLLMASRKVGDIISQFETYCRGITDGVCVKFQCDGIPSRVHIEYD